MWKIRDTKKILISLASTVLILGNVTAFAEHLFNSSASSFHGLYLGGSAGALFSTAKENTSSSLVLSFPRATAGTRVSTTALTNLSSNLANNAGVGALYIGYGVDYKKGFLAAEAFINASNYRMNSSGDYVRTQTFSNFQQAYTVANYWQNQLKVSPIQYGLDLRPGLLVTADMLLSARVGFSRAKLTSTSNASGAVVYSSRISSPTVITDVFPFEFYQSRTAQKTAFRWGMGIDYAFTSNWSARVDYTQVNYGKINLNDAVITAVAGDGFVQNGILTVINDTQIKRLSSNIITLGISRYFA